MALSLMIFPSLGYIWLLAICILASLWLGNWLGYINYFIDISPREYRPAFQVIGSCIGIPFSFIGYGLGAIIDNWGYAIVFVLGGIASIIAILASTRLLSRKQIKSLNLKT